MSGLIISDRFRAGDLEHWLALEKMDSLYAQRYRDTLNKKADKAIETISLFLKKGNAYCGVSFGKDSVVVAHLIALSGFSIPCVWIKVKNRFNPECIEVKNNLLNQISIQYLEIESNPGIDGETSIPGFLKAESTLKCDRYISGIRTSESSNRRLRGSKNTLRSCVPIAKWTTQEVFSYLWMHKLPIHPAYAMSNGGLFNRNYLRVASIGGSRGSQFDRRVWEEMYYRDVLSQNWV